MDELAPEPGPAGSDPSRSRSVPQIILSFDVEEHDRIEAATGLVVGESLKAHYRDRLAPTTGWLLDQLGESGIRATFFILGQIARHSPELVRAIHRDGHEVASHGLDHRRISSLTPDSFREDLRASRDALEQLTGEPVVGYRAPTFSVGSRTAWAIDVLAEEGILYDSSIYPVRHDRYGEPRAPRGPFVVRGVQRTILEMPPATLRLGNYNLPVGGGGYFRLFPLALLERAIRQAEAELAPPVVMLYFHPWEFDPEQERLPLRRLSRFRTYVGIGRSRGRLSTLMRRHHFARAVDVATRLESSSPSLPRFDLTHEPQPCIGR